jgi:hypothetical protein
VSVLAAGVTRVPHVDWGAACSWAAGVSSGNVAGAANSRCRALPNGSPPCTALTAVPTVECWVNCPVHARAGGGGGGSSGGGVSGVAVFFIVVAAMAATAGVMLAVYQYHFKRRFREDMRDLMLEYMPLAESDTPLAPVRSTPLGA